VKVRTGRDFQRHRESFAQAIIVAIDQYAEAATGKYSREQIL
jgi:hypothetical protein